MKRWLQFALILSTMLYIPWAFAQAPTGLWTTIDDQTGKKRALVRLSVKEDVLSGTIVRVFKQAGDTGFCKKCPEPFKNKPIEGLQFLWGVKDKGKGVWSGGKILDAETGKIYKVKLTQKGDKLYVRGYVGLSMLGKTQIWHRYDENH